MSKSISKDIMDESNILDHYNFKQDLQINHI